MTIKQLAVWFIAYFVFRTAFGVLASGIGVKVDMWGDAGGAGVVAAVTLLVASWMLANRTVWAIWKREVAS